MTFKITKLVFAVSILFTILLTNSTANAGYGTSCVKLSVYFGTPLDGICVGKGLCDDNATDGVSVSFMVSKNNPDVLMMIFSLSELQNKQPDQVAYFTDPSKTYQFGGVFSLSGSRYNALHLPANSVITTSCQTTVDIRGDLIITSIWYQHD